MVPLRRWSGYANRGRPDADDDADANEQNMRRHPLSSLRAFGPSFFSTLELQVSIVAARSPEEQKHEETPNENRTIYPADYFHPTSRTRSSLPVLEPRPTTRNRCAGFAKVCHPETIRLLVAFHRIRRPKVYRSRLASESRTSNSVEASCYVRGERRR